MGGGAKIEAFLDCVSPYSYFAFLYLLKNRAALLSHGVAVEFTPVFLGGVNAGSGNTPPWTNPVKGRYIKYDTNRARKYFTKEEKVKTSSFFPILSLLPQRSMAYVKATFPQPQYEAAFKELWIGMWEQGMDLSKSELLAEVLSRHFKPPEVRGILEAANSAEWKKVLADNTKMALDRGAFGAPWFWVRNKNGVEEPFFGSDRFHFMFEFLGLPWSDIELKPNL